MKRKAIQFLVMLLVLVIPAISFAQNPPPDPGNGGGPADAVPFDDTMNLVFLVAGIAFAMIVVAKRLKEWKKI